jgi:hypothetical protein
MMKQSWRPRNMTGRAVPGMIYDLSLPVKLTNSRWKLHLRPTHLPLISNLKLPPLPPYVTSVDVVFADFLGYIKKCIEDFIITGHGGGDQIWAALYPTMHVILTTPNGWEGAQQQRMRTAAHKAGLVDRNGGQKVHFVTEAEVRREGIYAVVLIPT